ncbi:MAG: bifunctional riboflavin kinase/FAD synthetase [Pseudomonadota bacterium]|jgi:riboflavin kinase/FMN adenylyltransferase
MELIRGGAARRRPAATPTGSAVTIGNFDGLHLGHQALVRRLDAAARPEGLRRIVLTFEPLPREVFAPHPVPRLTSLREKAAWLAASGLVDELHILRFNQALAHLPAEDFVREILVGQLHARHVLIGDDFRFGRARRGDFALLQRLGAEHGFSVEATPPVVLDGMRVSSTLVRTALSEGRVEDAARLLGRPYSLCARVTHGDKRGRLLGFPTLNLPLGRKHFALHGVFAVEILGLADRPLFGVANAGIRPTVGGLTPRVEAHVFDWSGDAYGQRVEVRFLAFLREEQRFAGLDALMAQIARDAAAARALLTGEFKANRE